MSVIQNIKNVSNDDKNIATLMHIGGIFFNFVPSIIVYLFLAKKGSWLKEEAKEALNFELSFLIYLTVSGVLTVILIGFLLFPVLLIFNWICAILAIVALWDNKTYNFPFTIKFLR